MHLLKDRLSEAHARQLEDTFLLLDALEQEASELKEIRPLVCLEIG